MVKWSEIGMSLILVGALSACGESGKTSDERARKPAAPANSGRAPHKPSSSVRATLRFTDVSAESGLVIENVSGDPKDKMAIVENLGQGAAFLDFDNDGDFDLYFANGDVFAGQTPRAQTGGALYENLGGFRFKDVTDESGVRFRGWAHGAYAVDFDADGWTDLYITCYLRRNVFLRNLGGGRFEDASEKFGGDDPGPSSSAAFFDADLDGDLDLYVGNYVAYDPKDPPNQGRPCEWKGLKVSCGPLGTPAAKDTFYENVDGKLIEATKEFGFDAEASYALGTVACDFDGDGDTDVYIANDSRPNYFFENLGKGKFRECGMALGVDMNEDGRAQAGMGLDAGDIDNDGRLDIFVTNFSHDTNTLYHNERTTDGRLIFSDATFVTKLGEASYEFLSWGTRLVDLDRDGWQDIIVVSGHVYPQVEGAKVGTTYAQRNQVFRSLGREPGKTLPSFEDVLPKEGDAFQKRACSRGLAVADLDDDGDHDLLIVEMDARPTLIRNDTRDPGHWCGFRLRQPGRNRSAIGALVDIEDVSGQRQMRSVTYGAGFFSTSDDRLHFGLGAVTEPLTSVTVRWPGGETTRYEKVPIDRYWILERGKDKPEPLTP